MYLVTSWPEVQTCNPFLDGLLQIKSQEPSCQFTSTDPNFFLKKMEFRLMRLSITGFSKINKNRT